LNSIYDHIFIGTGLGSLAMAALLTRKGKRVLVLEKANEPGGCASSYTKDGYRFDAGATTLVGWQEGLPLYELCKEMGVLHEFEIISPSNSDVKITSSGDLTLIRLNPSMKVHFVDEKTILRSEDKSRWIADAGKFFGASKRQERFWKLIFSIQDQVWKTSLRMKSFPPRNLKQFIDCFKNFRFGDLVLLFASFLRMGFLLQLPGFPKSKMFQQFLNEQLMITVQCSLSQSPVSMGAAGISYAHLQNYYVKGGIGKLAEYLVQKIQNWGGEVLYREEVNLIDFHSTEDSFEITTRKNNRYLGRNVFSGIPIWNHPKLLSESKGLKKLNREVLKRSKKFSRGIWGAFNLGIVMKEFLFGEANDSFHEAIHHQFHLPVPLPFGGGDSIFVSVSHPLDDLRTPKGCVILAVSTHLENPENWNRKDEDTKAKKLEIQERILDHLELVWNGFSRQKIIAINSASPATWETWTGRYKGRVGGIPGYYFRNPFNFPGSESTQKGFYFLGDTVYPGQGIPAVVLGALNLYKRTNFD
jgi:phytoene dehydrogenase-like protein